MVVCLMLRVFFIVICIVGASSGERALPEEKREGNILKRGEVILVQGQT